MTTIDIIDRNVAPPEIQAEYDQLEGLVNYSKPDRADYSALTSDQIHRLSRIIQVYAVVQPNVPDGHGPYCSCFNCDCVRQWSEVRKQLNSLNSLMVDN